VLESAAAVRDVDRYQLPVSGCVFRSPARSLASI
jgi:hypothetical protein